MTKAAARYERPAHLGPLQISVTPRMAIDDAAVAAFDAMGVHRLIPLTAGRADTAAIVSLVEDLAKRYVH